MKMKKPLLKPLVVIASILFWCAWNLPAQTAPTITTQPASQTNQVGTTVSFSVGATGTGSLLYQWLFNGTYLPNNIITTVAGYGNYGYSGDGGAATSANLYEPNGVAFDGIGNLYIADVFNNRVRRVDTNGIITTVAGNGTGAYNGDGGAATNASLYHPESVAFDAFGNMYIADGDNNRIRRVDINGIITTVAGNGTGAYAGDGGAATNASLYYPRGVIFDVIGNLYIADDSSRIRKVDTNGIISTVAGNNVNGGYSGDGGVATNASLNYPGCVAFDAIGNMYIADSFNNRIRKVDTNGIITTVAGNGVGAGVPLSGAYSGDGGAATNASLYQPESVAFDAFGNMYIADDDNNRIREVSTSGIITTVAGNGIGGYSGDGSVATIASLNHPIGVALDSSGNLYIGDENNYRIREVYLAGHSALTLTNIHANNAGNYTVVVTSPYGSVTSAVVTLTVPAPAVITVQPASQIAAIGSNPSFFVTAAGSGSFDYEWFFAGTNLLQSGTNSTLTLPNVSASNAGNYMVVVTNSYGSVTSQIAALEFALPPFVTMQPASQTNVPGTRVSFNVAVGNAGPFSYQWQLNGTNLPNNNNIITTVAGNGSQTYAGDGGVATNAGLYYPSGVTFDPSGNLFIADIDNNRIRKMDINGITTTVAGNGMGQFAGDGGGATGASLYFPRSVAFDAIGNLYIADRSNNRIRKVDTNGIVTTVAGKSGSGYSGDGGAATNASLYFPSGVALDASGNLYIADTYNNRIREVDANGIITTVAGKSGSSYSGDGGMATNANLYFPSGVAFDAIGNLFIADYGNNRIRKVSTNRIITTIAGKSSGPSYSGDGGAATNANLYYPSGVCFDALGNLYIADTQNNRIRELNTNGIITTVAGKGTTGFSGDGGTATNASVWYPAGIAFDTAGNLYVADQNNNRIREIQLGGFPTITLTNVSVNKAGNYSVIITSQYGSVTSAVATLTVAAPPAIIIQPASQAVAVGTNASFTVAVAGSGPFDYEWFYAGTNLLQSGTNSTFTLVGVSTNNAGNYSVAISNAYGSVTSRVATLTFALPPVVTIQPVSQTNLAGTAVSFGIAVTAVNAGPFTYQWQFDGTNLPNNIITSVAVGNLGYPNGMAFDTFGNLYVADYSSIIRRVDANGIITSVAGKSGVQGFSGDGGAATNAILGGPTGVAFDAFGNFFYADYINCRIRRVDTQGIITTVAGNGSATYAGDGGAAINASLNEPSGVAFDPFGNLFIADFGNSRIRKVDANGIITTVAGKVTSGFSGDGGAATNASLLNPSRVAFDASGNLFISDGGNSRIRKVANGIITTVAGKNVSGYSGDGGMATNASLYYTKGVACDAAGNLFIADGGNSRIRKVATNGIITTVAGGGSVNPGNGGAATNVSLSYINDVAFDAAGNLYISTQNDSRIREVHFAGYPTLVLTNVSATNAGNYSVVVTSPYGSVTSSVVSLTVIVPPRIVTSGTNFGFTTNGSGFGFNLGGVVGQTVVVEGSTNLVDWTSLFTNTVDTNSVYFFDPTATNFPGRFYRARLP